MVAAANHGQLRAAAKESFATLMPPLDICSSFLHPYLMPSSQSLNARCPRPAPPPLPQLVTGRVWKGTAFGGYKSRVQVGYGGGCLSHVQLC